MKTPLAFIAFIFLTSCGPSSSDCQRCIALTTEQQQATLARWKDETDPVTRQRLGFQFNFAREYSRAKTPASAQLVTQKYTKLESLVFAENITELAYHPLEAASVAKTFAQFGDLYIKESPGSGPRRGESVQTASPWAGYWFPAREKALFDGPSSPLAKLDRILAAKGRQSGAAQWERDNHLPGGESWEGLCFAWAMASAIVAEPTESIQQNDVTLTVADQKALWTKLFQYQDTEIFGVIYRGDAETDGTYQDLRPEALHQLLLKRLGENQPVVIDDDAGLEVWSKPAYKLNWVTTADSERDDRYKVKAYLSVIKQREIFDGPPTGSMDIVRIPLEYYLYVDKTQSNENGYKVIAGEWTGLSYASHPDVVWLPKNERNYQTSNPVLNASKDLVTAILSN